MQVHSKNSYLSIDSALISEENEIVMHYKIRYDLTLAIMHTGQPSHAVVLQLKKLSYLRGSH